MHQFYKDNLFLQEIDRENNIIINTRNFKIYKVNKDILDFIYLYLNNGINEAAKVYKKSLDEAENIIEKVNAAKESVAEGFTDVPYKIERTKLIISTDCNMSCKYCYAGGGNYGNKPMLMDETLGRKIVDLFIKLNKKVPHLSFFGGEPLLNSNFINVMCGLIRESNSDCQFNINSNFYNIPEGLYEIISKYDIKLTASIDGPKAIHNENRINKAGVGTFDVIYKNIKHCKQNTGQPRALEVTYTQSHREKNISYENIIEFLYKEFEIKNIIIADELALVQNEISDEEITKNVDFVFEHMIESENPISISNLYSKPLRSFIAKRRTDYFCDAAITNISILPNGDIYPCQLFVGKKDYYIGNVLYDSADLILESLLKFRSTFQKTSYKNNNEKCKNCISSWHCHRCIGIDYFHSKKLLNITSDFCDTQNKITLKTLEKLSMTFARKDTSLRFPL